jgi:hypothetical protein
MAPEPAARAWLAVGLGDAAPTRLVGVLVVGFDTAGPPKRVTLS